jgi:cellulase/cellobiase CelA1
MFSTGQTVVVGLGLAMAAALGFTTAKALQDAPAAASATTAAPAASAGAATAAGTAARAASAHTAPARTAAAAAGPCRARVVLQDTWPQGFKAEVRVTNHTGTVAEDWTVTFRMPPGAELAQGWNATLAQDGATVTARAPDWGRDLSDGATATFGFTASGTPKPLPDDVRLAGRACS